MVPSLPLQSCESSVPVKENPDRKKNRLTLMKTFVSMLFNLRSALNRRHIANIELGLTLRTSQYLWLLRNYKLRANVKKATSILTLKQRNCANVKSTSTINVERKLNLG